MNFKLFLEVHLCTPDEAVRLWVFLTTLRALAMYPLHVAPVNEVKS
jgi:hypothetical protein